MFIGKPIWLPEEAQLQIIVFIVAFICRCAKKSSQWVTGAGVSKWIAAIIVFSYTWVWQVRLSTERGLLVKVTCSMFAAGKLRPDENNCAACADKLFY